MSDTQGALEERLRDYAANGSRSWQGIEAVFTEAADEIASLRARVAVLEGALTKIADGDYNMPAETFYFPDQRESKHNQCKHGQWMYDGCDQCCADFARQALKDTPDAE